MRLIGVWVFLVYGGIGGSAGAEPSTADASAPRPAAAVLPQVTVTAEPDRGTPGADAAELLRGRKGVDLQPNGYFPLPVIHGFGDERVKVLIDGMALSSACPNHMNPPLSYLNPAQAPTATVLAGITPVSEGGDSLGGTVSLAAPPPVFAETPDKIHAETVLNARYGTNADSYSGSIHSAVASREASVAYDGAYRQAHDYKDGHGQRVTSTYVETSSQSVTVAGKKDGHLGEVTAGLTSTPREGFVSQWMDMTRNNGEFVNAHYAGTYDWGLLDARAYVQHVEHEMNLGPDKAALPHPMWMPMDTRGDDIGYTLKAEAPVGETHTLRVGNEFHRFELDDGWPPVPGSTGMMGPGTFVNINGGRRHRLSLYAEWETRYNPRWMTLFGVRNDTVWMDTGPVRGYSPMYADDADAFNARGHARTDVNFDLTALARYEPNATETFEFGYARKSRAPSLYERYAWSRGPMAAEMVNWFGDGNDYTGNLDLKSEIAHTVSATAGWHDAARGDWNLSCTPYYSYVQDYIDVDRYGTIVGPRSVRSRLVFANHDAQLYGFDFTGKKRLWKSERYGRGELRGIAGWVRGARLDGEPLYHMMPFHAELTLEETLGGWTGAVGAEAAADKSVVEGLRNEPRTPAYALMNLSAGYRWRNLFLQAGIDNVLDTYDTSPLGGVNLDAFRAGGGAGPLDPVAGPGRTFYTSLTILF